MTTAPPVLLEKSSPPPAGLSRLRAFWLLARPRLMPYVLLLPVVGFGWAHWDRALELRGEGALLLVMLAWMFLQAGTLWLNAALDRDHGPVLMGRPVALPGGLVAGGYAALLMAMILAFQTSRLAGYCALACVGLAVLYSHPATAWKGHPILGPLTNWIGYGLLSPLAGWSVVEVAPNPRSALVWLLSSLGLVGCYFAAQAFQGPEDKARGYRTFVACYGPVPTLTASRLCIGFGFAGGMLLALAGWLPRLCLAAAPFGIWVDRWLALWSRQTAGGNERWARGLAYRLLLAALVALGLAYIDYFWAWNQDLPLCGLGTAAGHPPGE